jgi:hypothetical protein
MSPTLLGMALGAASAFLLDPQQGRRRRALLRDKWVRSSREAREFGDAAARDLRGRVQGLSTQVKAHVGSLRRGPVTDDVLVARVRAKLGRYVSHPHAIRVMAQNGFVTLSGDVLAGEHGALLGALRSVPGVRDCAEGISALQGGVPPAGQRWELFQSSWSPGTRALVGGAGGLLALYALVRGGALGVAALAGGAALVARAKANKPLLQGRVVDRQPESDTAIGR